MLRSFKTQKNTVLFLLSSAIYRDGLNRLFAVRGIQTAQRTVMNYEEILLFAVGLNISAGIGAAGMAFIDDIRGSRNTIILSLCALIPLGIFILWAEDKMTFLVLAMG